MSKPVVGPNIFFIIGHTHTETGTHAVVACYTCTMYMYIGPKEISRMDFTWTNVFTLETCWQAALHGQINARSRNKEFIGFLGKECRGHLSLPIIPCGAILRDRCSNG